MESKLFEIRDTGTFIQGLAISLQSTDGYLAQDAGYGPRCILFGHAYGGEFSHDPYTWNDRTRSTAHHYIEKNWDTLNDGDLIDVEFILGEKDEKAISCQYGG